MTFQSLTGIAWRSSRAHTGCTYRSRALVALLGMLFATQALAGISVQSIGDPAGAAKPQVYRALLIGNDDYDDPFRRWSELSTAVSDARAVRDVLSRDYGFQDVQLLENATRRDVLLALSGLARRVMPEDNVLIYYAGHGFLDPDTNKGYWVPVDGKGVDHTTFLRNSTIRDELSIIASRARHTLLISDSCFSGSLLRSDTRGPAADVGSERYYQEAASKKSVQILSAGGLEYVDDDYRASGHSPFTYFLLNELTHNQRDKLAATELAANVTIAVANNSEQVPESGVLQGAGDELGEFIFLKLRVEVEGVPADKVKVDVEVVPAGEPSPPAAEPEPPSRTPSIDLPLPTL